MYLLKLVHHFLYRNRWHYIHWECDRFGDSVLWIFRNPQIDSSSSTQSPWPPYWRMFSTVWINREYSPCHFLHQEQTRSNTIQYNCVEYVLWWPCMDHMYIHCSVGEWLTIYTTSGDVDVLCAYMFTHSVKYRHLFLHVLVVGLYRYAFVVHCRISQSRVWVSLMIFILYTFVVFVWSVHRVRAFTALDRSSDTGLRFTPVFDTRVMFCYTPCIRVITLLMTVLGLCLPCGLSILYVRILMLARRSRHIRAKNTNHISTSKKKEIQFIFLVSLLLLTCLICYCGLLFVFKKDIN